MYARVLKIERAALSGRTALDSLLCGTGVLPSRCIINIGKIGIDLNFNIDAVCIL